MLCAFARLALLGRIESMRMRILFAWSDWLVGVDWTGTEMRSILDGWMVHFRLGPLVLQFTTVEEDSDE